MDKALANRAAEDRQKLEGKAAARDLIHERV
jgi:hypothetical protein